MKRTDSLNSIQSLRQFGIMQFMKSLLVLTDSTAIQMKFQPFMDYRIMSALSVLSNQLHFESIIQRIFSAKFIRIPMFDCFGKFANFRCNGREVSVGVRWIYHMNCLRWNAKTQMFVIRGKKKKRHQNLCVGGGELVKYLQFIWLEMRARHILHDE